MSRFDWAGLMRAGMTGLRLRPEEFWRLTPVELLLMLGREAREARFGRAELHALARQYPDGGTDGRD